MSVFDDPDVARLDIMDTYVSDGKVIVLGLKDWFLEYLQRGHSAKRRGKRGHATYMSLLSALKAGDRRAFEVFVDKTEGGKHTSEIALNLGISQAEVDSLLEIAKDRFGLVWQEYRDPARERKLSFREMRAIGLLARGHRRQDIGDLMDSTPEAAEAAIESALSKIRNQPVPD